MTWELGALSEEYLFDLSIAFAWAFRERFNIFFEFVETYVSLINFEFKDSFIAISIKVLFFNFNKFLFFNLTDFFFAGIKPKKWYFFSFRNNTFWNISYFT